MTGYVAAERRVDASGKTFFVTDGIDWPTEELARQWARFQDMLDADILPADTPRVVTESFSLR